MFRAAFMATTRLELRSREAAAAMLSLMRECFEVRLARLARLPLLRDLAQGIGRQPCTPVLEPSSDSCWRILAVAAGGSIACCTMQLPRPLNVFKTGAQVLVSQPSNGIMRLASGCIAALGHPGAALRMLVSLPVLLPVSTEELTS
jgi:hypothetical protein